MVVRKRPRESSQRDIAKVVVRTGETAITSTEEVDKCVLAKHYSVLIQDASCMYYIKQENGTNTLLKRLSRAVTVEYQ